MKEIKERSQKKQGMVRVKQKNKRPFGEIIWEDLLDYLDFHCYSCGKEMITDDDLFFYDGQVLICWGCVNDEDKERIQKEWEEKEKKFNDRY